MYHVKSFFILRPDNTFFCAQLCSPLHQCQPPQPEENEGWRKPLCPFNACLPVLWDESHLVNLTKADARKEPANGREDGVMRAPPQRLPWECRKGHADMIESPVRMACMIGAKCKAGVRNLLPNGRSRWHFAEHDRERYKTMLCSSCH